MQNQQTTSILARLVILATMALSGCSAEYVRVKDDGLYFLRYAYHVSYAQKHPRSLARGNWIVDNFHLKGSDWVINTGAKYQGTAQIDRDGDGQYETETVFLFDVKLNHRASNAVMWIQNQELSLKSTGKSLDVLLNNYASSLTGTGFYAEANVFSILHVKQKRYVAVIKERKKIVLGGRLAIEARIQVLNIDQRRIEPNHQGNTILVTILKTPYKYQEGMEEVRTGQTVMLIGYFNSTQDFAKLKSQYLDFRSQVHFSPIPGMPVPRIVYRPAVTPSPRSTPARRATPPPRAKPPGSKSAPRRSPPGSESSGARRVAPARDSEEPPAR